jgi:hypothetical protein
MAKRTQDKDISETADEIHRRGWVEPLVTLICHNLRQHAPAYERLREYIEEHWPVAGELDDRDIRRMIRKPIQHGARTKTDFMIELISDLGMNFIDALPNTDDGAHIKRVTTMFFNALVGESIGQHIEMDPVRRKMMALQDLFELQPTQIDEQQDVEGEYFGYRRSTTRGTVIRFSLKIVHIGSGIYEFHNYFFSRQDDWKVTGTGLFKEGNLYLVGNAASHKGTLGRGLRCFALRPEGGRQGMISGIVLTTEAGKRPIAARIFLVPVRRHKHPLVTSAKPLRLDDILEDEQSRRYWITDDVDIEELDRAIDVAGRESAALLVAKNIRNGTVSTVRYDGCEGQSDESVLPDENALLELLEEWPINPTILYLRAIKGAEDRLKQGRS